MRYNQRYIYGISIISMTELVMVECGIILIAINSGQFYYTRDPYYTNDS